VHAPYRSFTCSSSLLSCQRRFNSSYFWHDPLGVLTIPRSSNGEFAAGQYDIALGLRSVGASRRFGQGFPTEIEDFHSYLVGQQDLPVFIFEDTEVSNRTYEGFGGTSTDFYNALKGAARVHFDLTGINLYEAFHEGQLGARGKDFSGNWTANELMAIGNDIYGGLGKTTFYRRGPGGTWSVEEIPTFPSEDSELWG